LAYLLDTDVVSSVLRPSPDTAVLRRFATTPQTEIFTSAITVAELVYGTARKRLSDLERRIETLLATLPVVSFDELAGYRYGQLRADMDRSGESLAIPDLQIAATALAHDLILVTGNERHFRRVPGLTVENWLSS
jgi:tRNA(fMet)-specific endonuclease VapC